MRQFKVYASSLLVDPTTVPSDQCRVPEGAALNEKGLSWLERLKRGANDDGTDYWAAPTTIRHYRLMPPRLFTKNCHYIPCGGDLVVVGGTPRNVITSAVVMREGDFVLTNSGRIYEIHEEATEEELVKWYPLLVYDMVRGTPERERLLELSRKVHPGIKYDEE